MTSEDWRYWLRLPPGWVPLERTDRGIDAQVAHLLQAGAVLGPPTRAEARGRARAERQLTTAMRAARSPDVALAAVHVEPASPPDPAGSTDGRGSSTVAAAFTVTTHARPPVGDAITGLLSVRNGARTVDLPFAGPAVRVTSLEVVPVHEGPDRAAGTVRVALTQHLLPHPDGRRVLALNGMTSALERAEEFESLFDALAATFRFGFPRGVAVPLPVGAR